MAVILHISDLHFGPPFLPPVAEALLHAVQELTPDIIVVSGDFTQHAREDQFQAARAFLARLPDVPTIVTPGNHDVPQLPRIRRLFTPFERYRRYIRPELDYDLTHSGITFVSLNSVSGFGSLLNGWLTARQLEYAERVLAASPEENLRVVVAHHHLAPAPDFRGGNVMYRARRALEHFTRLRVDLVLGGHLHRAFIGNSLDFYPAARDHGIIVIQSGTTTSRRGRAREREKNTFNLIRSANDLIEVAHYMYFKEVSGFEVMSQHLFPRPGARSVGPGVQIQAFAR